MPVMRMAIQIAIGFAIAAGLVSAVLRAKKILGLTGMLLALVATMLGGSSVEINEPLTSGPSIGRSTAWGAKTPWVRVSGGGPAAPDGHGCGWQLLLRPIISSSTVMVSVDCAPGDLNAD
jgi:hypothetical protein